MRKLFCLLSGLLAIAFTSCTNEELDQFDLQSAQGTVSIQAYTPADTPDTRITFTPNGNKIDLAWEREESFSVIHVNQNAIFSKNTDGNTFTGTLPEKEGNNDYYAAYPVTTSTDMDSVPYDLTLQTGQLNSELTYMRARSADGSNFSFEHCVVILKATFSGLPAGSKIKQIYVTTKTPYVKGNYSLFNGEFKNGASNRISIHFATAVSTDTPVYIYLPPMNQADKELLFEVTTDDGKFYTATLEGEAGLDVPAGLVFRASVSLANSTPYLTFRATSMQRFSLIEVNTGGTYTLDPSLQYQVGDGEWQQLTFENTLIAFGGNIGDLRIRGKSINGTADGSSNKDRGSYIKFDNDVPVVCTGDIRTLLDWENYTTVSTSSACFKKFFYNCTQLISAPDLPATQLCNYCYAFMFQGCTNLAVAPVLPAPALSTSCYSNMFNGCTSLKHVTMLATSIGFFDLLNWMANVSSTGTFVKAPSKNDLDSGSSGIPSGWTVVNYGE